MKEKGYKSFSEFLLDYKFFIKNPNDDNFLKNIETKIVNSEYKLKSTIRQYIAVTSFGKTNNDLEVIQTICYFYPDSYLHINSEENPYFGVM